MDQKAKVKRPEPSSISNPTVSSAGTRRSYSARLKNSGKSYENLYKHFAQNVQTIQIPKSFEDLVKPLPKHKQKMEKICNTTLGPNQPAQCMSAKFVDEEGETVFVYFAHRIINKNQGPPVSGSFCLYNCC